MNETNINDVIEFHKGIIPLGSDYNITKALEKRFEELGEENFTKEIEELGTISNMLQSSSIENTSNTNFTSRALSKIKDPTLVGDEFNYSDKENEENNYTLKNRTLDIANKDIRKQTTDKDIINYFILAKRSNIRSILLYNSGFKIVIKNPRLSDLNTLYNQLGIKFDKYGRLLGALFYVYSDIVIKNTLWDFIESLVIGSNLINWNKDNNLKKHVSIQDYQLILLSIQSLIYKEGYIFKSICPHCNHIEEDTIDLNLLQQTDFGRIPIEARKFLAIDQTVTPEDLVKYKQLINKDRSFQIKDYKFYLEDPSMYDFLEYGTTYNKLMSMSISDMDDEKFIEEYVTYNTCSIFKPWIVKIEFLGENNEVLLETSNSDNIITVLNDIQDDNEFNNEFSEKMEDFIQNNNLTIIGYLGSNCICGKSPDNMINGIIPIDVQSNFFSMLVTRLIAI